MLRKRKMLIIALIAFFIVAFLFASLFSQIEHDHDCTGDDCPICAVLHFVQDFLSSIKRPDSLIALFILFVASAFALSETGQRTSSVVTPVSLNDVLTF